MRVSTVKTSGASAFRGRASAFMVGASAFMGGATAFSRGAPLLFPYFYMLLTILIP